MKPKLAILGASYLQKPLVEKARELGIFTICFAWDKGAICKNICNKFFPLSILDKEEILKVCRDEQIDGITSIATDIAVPTMAYVSSHMNLIGNTVESSEMSTNKYLMRNAFNLNNLPIPHFAKIANPNDLESISLFEFPLIVKPVDRSGSLGITKVNDNNSLISAVKIAIENSFKKQAIVEEYIQGDEISVETISWNGEHHILAYTDKVTSGYPNFVELEHHQPSGMVNPRNKNVIDKLVNESLGALKINNGASHVEIIITKDGYPIIIEIGARMGGDFIGSHLVELSTGYDFLTGVIETALGQFSVPNTSCNKYSGVYFQSNITPNLLSYIEEFDNKSKIVHSGFWNNDKTQLQSSADRNGFFIYESDHKLRIK